MLRKGKTDQKREGRKIGIPYGKDPLTCPVQALCEWIAEAQITSGPLFRAVTKFGRVRPTRLCDRVVAEIVKRYCKQIGKRVPLFSGHSLRAGFATSAAIAGASERSIQKQTGHASVNVLRRYIREAEMFRGSRSHPESGCILNRLPRNPRYFSVNSWMIVNISYDRYLSSRTVVDFGSCEVFSIVFV